MNEFERHKAGPTQETLRALLQAQGDLIYNVCYQVLLDGASAEDAAQQVLLDLVRQLPRIVDASHLKAWVSRASFHAALDLKKKARRRAEHERRTVEVQQTPALTPDQVEAIHEGVAQLDDDLQRVVVEHYFEKRPLRDLAAEQSISEVAIWKRLQKAKERLRVSLAATGFASALLGLDSLLEALEPVRAPEGLVGPGLLTPSAAGASGGLVLAGGMAMKLKLTAAAGLIALLVLAGFGISRQRDREALSASGEVSYHYESTTAKPVLEKAPAPPSASDPATAAAGEEVQTFTSFMGYYQAMRKASLTVDLKQRTLAFRRLGLGVTEAEMAAASQGCPFRPGTQEFAEHILNALDKMQKAAEPAKVLAMFRGFTDIDDKTRKKFIRRLFEEWGERDPATARAVAAGLAESEGRSAVLSSLADPDTSSEGLARLGSMAEGPDRLRAVEGVVAALVRADPSQAVGIVEGLPLSVRADARRALAREWTSRDFDAAIAWIERTSDRMTRDTLLLYAVSRAAETNPRAAGEAVLRLVDFKQGQGLTAVSSVVDWWARTDPAAAAKFLDRVPSFPGRNSVAAQLMPRWGAVDPVEALVWAQQQPAAERAELVGAALTGWVKSPKATLAEAREMTRRLPEEMRPRALEAVVLAWSEIESPAAASFALTETPKALSRVVSQWLMRDDVAALEWAKGLPDHDARDRALYGVVQGYLQVNPTKALGAAEAIRGAAMRDKVLGELAGSISESSGIDAGLEILRKVGDAAPRDRALGMMITRVSRESPRKAVDLVELVSDPARRAEAIGSILTWGSAADPTLCRELLGKLPRVECLHYQRVAGGFAKKDPVAAATWALTLPEKQMDPQPGDPSKEYEGRPREAALNAVVNTWAASNPDAATRWIKEAPVEEGIKSSLLQVVRFQRDFRKR